MINEANSELDQRGQQISTIKLTLIADIVKTTESNLKTVSLL